MPTKRASSWNIYQYLLCWSGEFVILRPNSYQSTLKCPIMADWRQLGVTIFLVVRYQQGDTPPSTHIPPFLWYSLVTSATSSFSMIFLWRKFPKKSLDLPAWCLCVSHPDVSPIQPLPQASHISKGYLCMVVVVGCRDQHHRDIPAELQVQVRVHKLQQF